MNIPDFPGKTTPASKPPMVETEEAKQKHLELARDQGEALEAALMEMMDNVAQDGKEIRAGEYLVGYAIEKPEGLYQMKAGGLKWQEPEGKNIHIEISVRDAGSGRLVPGLQVMLTVLDAGGKEIGTHRQKLLWHPWLYHYGRNWKLPGDGKYTFRVYIPAPDFPRHDEKNGKRFAEPVWAEFTGVKVETKQPGK